MKKIIAALIAMFGLNTAAMPAKHTVTLQIVQTSDVHGCFFPYDFINQKAKEGSLARISDYVNSLRQAFGDDHVVLLDNGDILQGQPVCYYYNFIKTDVPNVAAEMCNYMRYDAQTIGNHDVETGHAVYDKWIRESEHPILGANMIDNTTGKPYLKPYTILERSGLKIAILGMITPAIPNWLPAELWEGVHFDDMLSTAKKWMTYIQENERPDIIVGLFHSGKEGGITTPDYQENEALKVAQEVPGFDVVFFGHDHRVFCGSVTCCNGKDVVCLDPANNAMRVALATVNITMKGKKIEKKTVEGSLVDISEGSIDSAFTVRFQQQEDEVEAFVSKKIGLLKNTMTSNDTFFGNSAFGDFILSLEKKITNADIAFNAPLSSNSVLQAGDVKVSDLFKLYKYENSLYTMRLTGKEIRNYLEMSYDQWFNTMKSANDHLLLLDSIVGSDGQTKYSFKYPSFNFDSALGIDYEVDVRKPNGEKLTILKMSDGRPFEDNKWYTVAVNSYRGNGGGELLTRGAGIPLKELPRRIVWKSRHDLRYYIMQAFEQQGEVDARPADNWRLLPIEWTENAANRDRKIMFGE